MLPAERGGCGGGPMTSRTVKACAPSATGSKAVHHGSERVSILVEVPLQSRRPIGRVTVAALLGRIRDVFAFLEVVAVPLSDTPGQRASRLGHTRARLVHGPHGIGSDREVNTRARARHARPGPVERLSV